jgi:hypothetical protein
VSPRQGDALDLRVLLGAGYSWVVGARSPALRPPSVTAVRSGEGVAEGDLRPVCSAVPQGVLFVVRKTAR